ncbi:MULTISPECIES: hypothetical protein [unclassified Mesorhizobium]|uniref:hypothetical protein n=1 Tax=unclassified Mesorhizobium TaxID=325217 RepID=UPI00167A84E8|nr:MULTISPECIES: hypothetical protein [unclassified Mesorhizobium]
MHVVFPKSLRTFGSDPAYGEAMRFALQASKRVLVIFKGDLGQEQFQEKCVTVFRPELRKNKYLRRFGDSMNR